MTAALIWKWCVAHWRWFVYAAAAIAVGWMLLLIRHWHADSLKLEAAEVALAHEILCDPMSECAKRIAKAEAAAAEKQREIDQEVISGYVQGLQTVADYAASHPAPVVRLCRPANPSNVRVSKSTTGTDGPATSGDDAVETGQDIGRELYQAADELDREVVKLIYLQRWNAAVAKGEK